MIFESHAHYDDEKFDADREELFASLKELGVARVINVCSDVASLQTTPALAEEHEFLYAAVGIHPSDIGGLTEDILDEIRALTKRPKVVSIGEIGLDYYWDKEPEVQERQRYWFRRQLSLAKETGLPVIIHSREAAKDTMEIMREAAQDNIPGVIHCYSYTKEQALEYTRLGYYIGVGGVVTFKNGRRLKETVAEIPLSRILIETDCPYLAPEPHRGERNSSLNLPLVISAIADIKGLPPQEVEETTYQNAVDLFGVK